jgi:hypothetical protein
MIISVAINAKKPSPCKAATAAELAALPVRMHFETKRGHLASLTMAASRHKMKRSEFIRHLLNTHPLMQEQPPC